jgi:beta-aspartyl-dipeptidase (metallo-type)
VFLLRNANLLTPEPEGVVDVLLGGGQVLAIGPSLSAGPAGWPVEEIDCAGCWLVPGFIDAHTHLAGGGGEGGARTRVPPVVLTDLTLAGVTTAVGLLGTDCRTRSVAELLACARGLSELGLTALVWTGGYEVPPRTLMGSVRDDLVHVDRIIGIGEMAISDHRSSQPTFDEFLRLAADAHVSGMMTGKAGTLHLHLGDGARGLDMVRRALDETELPARTFQPTHCNRNRRLWQEAKSLAWRGVPIDVTAFEADADAPSGGQAIAEWYAEGLPAERLTLSSDGGGCLPTFDADGVLLRMEVGASRALLQSIVEAVNLGVPLEFALATVTLNVARQLRLPSKGRLAVGADADCVVLDRDLRVREVFALGRPMVRASRAVRWGPFEEPPG